MAQVPTFASLFTIFSILGAAVFFQELGAFCPERTGLFILSVAVCTSGVGLLYLGRPPPEEDETSDHVDPRFTSVNYRPASGLTAVSLIADYWDRRDKAEAARAHWQKARKLATIAIYMQKSSSRSERSDGLPSIAEVAATSATTVERA